MKHFSWVFLVALVLLPGMAFAQEIAHSQGTSVTIDFGEPAAWAITAVGAIITGIWSSVVGLIPGPGRWFIKTTQIDQVILRAIQAWVAKNAEEVAHKSWSIDVKNKAVAEVSVIALNTGNKFVKDIRDTLPDKVRARLQEYIEKQAKG